MTLRTTAKRGWTQAQRSKTFWITLIFTFYFLPWEPDPSQNMRTDPVFRLDTKWEPSIRFSWQFLTGRFSLRTGQKTGAGFQLAGENRPKLVWTPQIRSTLSSMKLCKEIPRWCKHSPAPCNTSLASKEQSNPLPQFCDTAEVATILERI
jgi:hypothetical protein